MTLLGRVLILKGSVSRTLTHCYQDMHIPTNPPLPKISAYRNDPTKLSWTSSTLPFEPISLPLWPDKAKHITSIIGDILAISV